MDVDAVRRSQDRTTGRLIPGLAPPDHARRQASVAALVAPAVPGPPREVGPNLRPAGCHYSVVRNAPTPAEALSGKSPLRAKRVDLEIPVQLRSRAGVGPGLVKNVCAGGLFVATARLLAVGDWVVVSMTIPGATEAVEILGEVRWSRPFQDLVDVPAGLGLRFVETPVRAAVLALELQRIGATST